MSQLTGSGLGHGTNYAMVDDSLGAKEGRLFTDAVISETLGILSVGNSTTSNLGIDSLFTGTSEEVKNYAAINISVFANQNSATDGLSLQWSQDGTNWDEKLEISVIANEVRSYEYGIRARYFRIIYTNGGVAQTTFRLQTMYHATRTRQGAIPISTVLTGRETIPTTRSIITARKPSGDYINLDATAGGNLKVSVEEFDESASLPSGTNIIGKIEDSQTTPIDSTKNNPLYNYEYITSGTSSGVTGSEIGSIIQFIGTGSYVSVISYSNDLITSIGSWS